MLPKLLMALSAGIILTIGILHLVYTFWGPKLLPRDPALQAAMSKVHPRLTRETTMWRVWMGVNATHSLCLVLFGLVYGYLALFRAELLFGSAFLLAVGFVLLAGLLVLAKLYFFSVPFMLIAISLVCYVASIFLQQA